MRRGSVRRGRDRYGPKHRLTLHEAAREVLCSSTQARQRGDVADKNDRQKVNDKQDSATGFTCLNRKRRRLTGSQVIVPVHIIAGLGQSTVDGQSNQQEMCVVLVRNLKPTRIVSKLQFTIGYLR